MTTVMCPRCTIQNDGDAAVCTNCGYRFPVLQQKLTAPQGARALVIGRDPKASRSIQNDSRVSWRHAQVWAPSAWNENTELLLEDLNSTNGTALNSPDNFVQQAAVYPGDVLYIGDTILRVRDILQAEQKPRAVPSSEKALQIKGGRMVIGRDPQADLPLNHPMVSWHHAAITREGTSYFIEDLGSTNGTFIGGQRVMRRTPIRVGQDVGLGSYTFRINEIGQIEQRDNEGDINVEVRDLAVVVPAKGGGGKTLIHRLSLTVEAGEMVALMGPSGAGKTTLMCAMNGITTPSSGEVRYQGKDLTAFLDRYRPLIGYVPQDDIMHPQLTVFEALYYTARLRLPAGTRDHEIHERIQSVLKSLNLEKASSVLIGYPGKKGISGGQRKRVNLAMELLADPTILFLDEPTSGLSSRDARTVVELLRSLADRGKTIVVTIHQPSYDTYEKFHMLALVSNHADPRLTPDQRKAAPQQPGELVYYGPALRAFDFFSQGKTKVASPDAMFDSMESLPLPYWTARYEGSSEKQSFVRARAGAVPGKQQAAVPKPPVKYRFSQLSTLTRRMFRLKLGDNAQMWISFLLPVMFGTLVCLTQSASNMDLGEVTENFERWLTFSKKMSTAHFLGVIAALWFGCNNAVREIIGEKAILVRERMVNLSYASYLGSKYAVYAVLNLIQCLLMWAIVYFGCGLSGSFFPVLLVLWLLSMVGTAIGLFISAWVPTNEAAVASLPFALLPMIVLGGSMAIIGEMSPALRTLTNFTVPTRWAYEAILVHESKAQEASSKEVYFSGLEPKEAGEKLKDAEREIQRMANQMREMQQNPRAAMQANNDGSGSSSNKRGSTKSEVKQKKRDLADLHFQTGRNNFTTGIAVLCGFFAYYTALVAFMLKKEEWEWWKRLTAGFR